METALNGGSYADAGRHIIDSCLTTYSPVQRELAEAWQVLQFEDVVDVGQRVACMESEKHNGPSRRSQLQRPALLGT